MHLSEFQRVIIDELRLFDISLWDSAIVEYGGEQCAVNDALGFLDSFQSRYISLDGASCPALTLFQKQCLVNKLDGGKSLSLQDGHVIILERIGSGSVGTVFSARLREQGKPDRLVCVKRLSLPAPGTIEDTRLQREVRLLCEGSGHDHPNRDHVVKGLDSFCEGGQFYLLMEFCPGRTLEEVVRQHSESGRALSVRHVILLIDSCLKGLSFLHDTERVHRDLKPRNLIHCEQGGDSYFVKIVDLGVVKVIDDDVTDDHMIIGTPYFMAPECCGSADTADVRSDLYSIAATLYYLLTGEPPAFAMFLQTNPKSRALKASDLRIWGSTSPNWSRMPLAEIREEVPQMLSDLIYRTLSPDRDSRPSNISVFRQDFDVVMGMANRAREVQKKIPGFRSGLRQAVTSVVNDLNTGIPVVRNASQFVKDIRKLCRKFPQSYTIPQSIPNCSKYSARLQEVSDSLQSWLARMDAHLVGGNADETGFEGLFLGELLAFQQMLPRLLSLQHCLNKCISGFI